LRRSAPGLEKTVERLKAEIRAAQDKISGLDAKLSDKTAVAEAEYKEAKAKLDADTGTANDYAEPNSRRTPQRCRKRSAPPNP
jgi:multidrug resistance efflux pump